MGRWKLAGWILSSAALGGSWAAAAVDRVANAMQAPETTAEQLIFDEVAAEVGLEFIHFNGKRGEFYFPEIMAGGGALVDYDGDGDLDVYAVQGGLLGTPTDEPAESYSDRLFRNDLVLKPDGSTVTLFVDVTERSRIAGDGYGMGVATGDFDNDGWVDLYVTNFGSNQLLRNNGDGTFSDVTEKSGADDERWSTSASFFDFDRDGWLDLYAANYVNYRTEANKHCFQPTGARDYCGPISFQPAPDSLFHNRGDGTFEDVSLVSGIRQEVGSGLGVVAADFNSDGWPDFYVANDQRPNHLWMNQINGTFLNEALLGGAAVDAEGRAQASMGIAIGDFDDDGDEDLFLSHIMGETNTLYTNLGEGLFVDRSSATRLGQPSRPFTGFGTRWFDFDNDGWLDLFIANGEVKTIGALAAAGDPFPHHQPNQLYQNLGDGHFLEISQRGGPGVLESEVSRGTAFGDLENDGDTDLVVFNDSGPVRLLLNSVGNSSRWLGLRLIGERTGRDLLGARLRVTPARGRERHRRVHTDGSYCSASDPRVLVGLGAAEAAAAVRVYWPHGGVEEWRDLPVDRYYVMTAGGE